MLAALAPGADFGLSPGGALGMAGKLTRRLTRFDTEKSKYTPDPLYKNGPPLITYDTPLAGGRFDPHDTDKVLVSL